MLTSLKSWVRPDNFHAVLSERSVRWYNACLRITRDADLAADAVQEALLKAWDRRDEFRGIVRLYRDLIRLRLNKGEQTRGLMGQHVQLIRVDDANNVIAFRRWMDGGPGDDVVIVANFERNPRDKFEIGFPAAGAWKLHLNSDWVGYSAAFGTYPSGDVTAVPGEYDGLPAHAPVNIGPYSVLVFSQIRGSGK